MHANPAVDMTFTMTGNSQFLAANQGFLLAFLKDPKQRATHCFRGRAADGWRRQRFPGVITFLQPNPVLQISTGATS